MSKLYKRHDKYYLYAYENGKKVGMAVSKDKGTAIEFQDQYDKKHERIRLGLAVRDVPWFDFCEEYLGYARTNKAARSVKRDDITIRTFNKLIPLAQVAEFNVATLERYKAIRKEQGLLASTINRELNTLKNMGQKLEDFGYAERNPIVKVKWLVDKTPKKIRFFDKDEISRILKVAGDPWRMAITIGLYIGMRRGEICHAAWDWVDFDKRTITIQARGSWQPKDYEIRTIPLHPRLLAVLDKLKRKAKGDNLVTHADGTPIGEDVLTVMTKKILTKAEISNASFHTTRHTFASHLVMSGVDLFVISKLLGHSSINMTEKYAHLRPDFMKNTVDRLDF